jgi:putative inorganic carbon (hco3(-)) transporter
MELGVKMRSAFPFFVVASLAMSPFLYFPLVSGAHLFDNQRLLEVSCALLVLVTVWFQLVHEPEIPRLMRRPLMLLLALFFLLGLVSSSAAYSPRHAFLEWTNLLMLVGAAWLVASEISTKGDLLLDKVLMLCGLACASYLLLEIAVYIAVLKTGEQPEPSQLIVGFDNYRFLNHVQTIALPMLGLMAARMPDRGRKLFWWGVTALWWMLLFLSAGRGTFVGLIVAIAIAWSLLHKAAATWCRSMLLSGLAGLIAYLFFYAVIPMLRGLAPFGLFFATASRTIENPTSGRLQLWIRALEMVGEDPWLGAGPLHFAHYGSDLKISASPHSWLLQIASEWGLPALLLLCGALTLSLLRLWQLRKVITAKDQDTLTAWLVTGTAILVNGLVSGLIVMPTSQLWIALYVGCAWGWTYSLSPAIKNVDLRPTAFRRSLISLAALLMIFFLGHGIWPELKELGMTDACYSQRALHFPRIFIDGGF